MPTKTERAYMPHIWIQKTGIGPNVKVWAGQISGMPLDREGIVPVVRVRFARLTKAGFDELTEQLQADISRIRGAA